MRLQNNWRHIVKNMLTKNGSLRSNRNASNKDVLRVITYKKNTKKTAILTRGAVFFFNLHPLSFLTRVELDFIIKSIYNGY